jgi:hypothetical protein
LPRNAAFYFGSLIFFVGLLLFALGVSKIISAIFDFLTIAELVSGFILMVIGYRATRPTQRQSA